MAIDDLANKIADISFSDGYVFANGTPFRERLGETRAKGLLEALALRGYELVHREDLPAAARPASKSA